MIRAAAAIALGVLHGAVAGVFGFACTSDMNSLPVVKPGQKGIGLDDTTFRWCSAQIPNVWPNTQEPVQSVRTFKSWEIDWPDFNREEAAANFVKFAKDNSVKVLVGTTISCNETDDALDWNRTMDLLRKLGPEQVMGLAVGNEMDLLHTKDYVKPVPSCIPNLWAGGSFWRATTQRIAELDSMGPGFRSLPVTSVFSAAALNDFFGHPFMETSNALVTSYLRNASATYGKRWVWSFNTYTFWNPFYNVDFPYVFTHTCNRAVRDGTCWAPGCGVPASFVSIRRKIKAITGQDDDVFWIGETGWSAPNTDSPPSRAARLCPDFSSKKTFSKFYQGFLSYDMGDAAQNVRGPDHVFFFTLRDASQFGTGEHFGLLEGGPDPAAQCTYTDCKLQATDFTELINVSAAGSASAGSTASEAIVV